MKLWTGALVAAAAVGLYVACGWEKEKGSGLPGGGSGPCEVSPGQFPGARCDSSAGACPAGACVIDAKCGDKGSCLPMADNRGKSTLDLRIRSLNVQTPEALRQPFIHAVVIDKGINLNAAECAEKGDGAFNWLMRIQRQAGASTGTVVTGGAPPSADPFGVGYCFARFRAPNGIAIAPSTIGLTYTGETASSEPIPKLYVPIFVGGKASNLVILPLTNARFKDVTVSAEGNCIGHFDPAGLEGTCLDNRANCLKWKTDGALGGAVTLEEADTIELADLGKKSLCAFLSGKTDPANNLKCARGADGKVLAKGDFCSTTSSAGGCADSYWLAATFAAAAVKIHDGASVPECQGAEPADGGADGASEAGADAGVDAASDAAKDAATD